jgi:hypothetical protein
VLAMRSYVVGRGTRARGAFGWRRLAVRSEVPRCARAGVQMGRCAEGPQVCTGSGGGEENSGRVVREAGAHLKRIKEFMNGEVSCDYRTVTTVP